ncbi:SDR family NAD(P)-dependent oxidoreductase [Streptomyces jeddahensis]|uniref:SDR family NAD(P)-dependent oxidoreductase n=1 Tax=Streptomyces jeddahensis TaxID=1716141 RepID=UPI000D1ADB7B
MRRPRRHHHELRSVGGFVGCAGWGVYRATKFAVEGLTEAMALEPASLGTRSAPWSRTRCVPKSSTARRCTAPLR